MAMPNSEMNSIQHLQNSRVGKGGFRIYTEADTFPKTLNNVSGFLVSDPTQNNMNASITLKNSPAILLSNPEAADISSEAVEAGVYSIAVHEMIIENIPVNGPHVWVFFE